MTNANEKVEQSKKIESIESKTKYRHINDVKAEATLLRYISRSLEFTKGFIGMSKMFKKAQNRRNRRLGCSKYMPHQGKQECERRLRNLEKQK